MAATMEIAGKVYELTHLSKFNVTLDGKGKNGAPLIIEVSFSSHVFSKACEPNAQDMLDENRKPRAICSERYAFSLHLPALVKSMIEKNFFCWESLDRNRASNYAVIKNAKENFSSVKDGRHKIVYFYLYPDTKNGNRLKLHITSCHERHLIFSRITRRYNVHTLLRKCLYEQKRIP